MPGNRVSKAASGKSKTITDANHLLTGMPYKQTEDTDNTLMSFEY
jgi:hypothetical protein